MSHSSRGADESSRDLLSSNGGIVDELLNLIRSYCREWSLGVSSYQGFPLRDEVQKLQQRINTCKVGEQNLDQRLARAPAVRGAVLRILMPCVWELHQGLSLYRPSTQNILGNDTDRIMEQATTLYRYVPPEGKPLSHTDIVEFITTGHASFKSHIDNLFETLPTLDSLFENSDSINTQPGQEGTLNVGIASESSGQTISGIHPSYLRGDAESAEFHSNHSSGSAGSSDVSSVFTQNGNNSSAQPMTDTRTSTSTSHSHEHQRDTEERTPFGVHQIIMVRNHSYQTEEPHLSLFDSGSSKNFILRDAVSKLNLEIHRLPNEVTVQLLGEFKYELCEYVEPDWQLQRRQKRHQNDQFLVVNALPNDYRMIIGRATYVKMGIEFFANESNLVAYLTVQKGSSKDPSPQEQLSRALQRQDGATHWNQKQKTIEREYAITRGSSSSGKPPYRALQKEENSTAQVKQNAASLCKQAASSANKSQ